MTEQKANTSIGYAFRDVILQRNHLRTTIILALQDPENAKQLKLHANESYRNALRSIQHGTSDDLSDENLLELWCAVTPKELR